MKKIYFSTSLLLLTYSFGNSQNIIVQDQSGINITGDTVEVSGLPIDDPIEYAADVRNLSGSSKNIKCTRFYITQPAGMTASFCWGTTCYPSFVDTSTYTTTLTGGEINNSFRADGHPNGYTGILFCRYKFYDEANPNDSADIYVKFLVGVSSVESAGSYSLSNVYPNPAQNTIHFNYQLGSNMGASIKIYDLGGKKVKDINLTSQDTQLKADVSSLTSGVYFYTLYVNGKAMLTKRLVISR